jgi:hypothetical protein
MGNRRRTKYKPIIGFKREHAEVLIMRRIAWILVTGLIVVLVSFPPVLADEKDSKDPTRDPWEHLLFRLGGFITRLNSDVTFGIEDLGAGIVINVEDALGLDTSTSVFRGEVQ